MQFMKYVVKIYHAMLFIYFPDVFPVTKRRCDKFAEGINEIMQAIEKRIEKDFHLLKNDKNYVILR